MGTTPRTTQVKLNGSFYLKYVYAQATHEIAVMVNALCM